MFLKETMALYTKSIQRKRTKHDGIRICIMRRPDSNADYDIWMPTLAPSHELLNAYHRGEVNWDQFVVRFTKEVPKRNKKFVELLADMASKRDVTILCWEETPEMCHRRLVAEACQEVNPRLSVVLK